MAPVKLRCAKAACRSRQQRPAARIASMLDDVSWTETTIVEGITSADMFQPELESTAR
ncbi:hypothetical protein OH687_28880 [Burkholderia anthina]|nr:hypothetical protein OH687_28880 [Burkholderia anthina]